MSAQEGHIAGVRDKCTPDLGCAEFTNAGCMLQARESSGAENK